MAPRFCSQCGTPITTPFCARCGAPAGAAPPAPPGTGSPAGHASGHASGHVSGPAGPVPPAGFGGPPPGWTPPLPPHAAPRPPAGSAGRRWAVVGVALAVLLTGAGIGTWLLTRSDDDSTSGGPGGLAVEPLRSVLGQPGTRWSLDVAEVVGVGEAELVTLGSAYDSAPEPLVVGGTVVHGVQHYDDVTEETRNWLVGIRATDGEVSWVREGESGWWSPTCVVLDADDAIACYSSADSEDPRSRVDVLEASSGTVVSSTDYDGRVGTVASHGGTVYVAGTWWDPVTERVHALASAGTVRDTTSRWSQEFEIDDPAEEWEDSASADADGLLFHTLGGSYRFAAGTGDRQQSDYVEEVYSDTGELRVLDHNEDYDRFWFLDRPDETFDGRVWTGPDDRVGVRGGLVGGGTTLYDAAGHRVVREVSEDPDADVTWAGSSVLRVSTSSDHDEYGNEIYTQNVLYTDARTGAALWQDHEARYLWRATEDAHLSVGDESDTFQVRSLRNGRLAWSAELELMDHSGESPYQKSVAFSTTAEAVTVSTPDQMWGFSDFGTPDEDLEPEASDLPARAVDLELGEEYVTRCGSVPEFVPVAAESRSGAVRVTFEVRATCGSGQWLDASALRLAISGVVPGSDGEQTLAEGVFDFTGDPVWVPAGDGYSQVAASFPVSQVWATPEEIEGAIEGDQVLVDCEEEAGSTSGTGGGGDGSEDAEQQAPTDPDQSDAGESASLIDEDLVDAEEREENSLAALRRLAAADADDVAADLVGSWVPQLSSKKDGTHDRIDARTYDYTAIYDEHLQLRLAHPDVRLLWSGDYGSFRNGDYWVTVAGVPTDEPGSSLDWCRDSGREPSHCFAKLLRVEGPAEETTRAWKR